MIIVVGIPFVFMELCLGQYTGHSPIQVFGRLAPALKAFGWAMVGVTSITGVYQNVIMAWSLFYLGTGLRTEPPWIDCKTTECFKEIFYGKYGIHDGDDYTEWPRPLIWEFCLCLLATWTITCLALVGGVRNSGKIVYFTVIVPFIGLVILFIYSLTQHHERGVADFFLFDYEGKINLYH